MLRLSTYKGGSSVPVLKGKIAQGGSLPGSPVRRRKAAPPPPPLLRSSPRRRRHDEEPPG